MQVKGLSSKFLGQIDFTFEADLNKEQVFPILFFI